MVIGLGVPLVYQGKEIGVIIKQNDFGEFITFSEPIPFQGEDRDVCLWAELPHFDFTEESKKTFCAEWAKSAEYEGQVICDTPIDDETYPPLKALFPPDTNLGCIDSYVYTMEYIKEQEEQRKKDIKQSLK